MVSLIARPGRDELRLFPAVGPGLYAGSDADAATADQRAARRLLGQAGCRGLARYGWRLSPVARLRRLLHFHRLALEAELAGKPRRGDAFWDEVVRELRLLPEDSPAWKELAAELAREPGVTELNDPVRLRRRLVDEVLLDSLCGLYNGRVRGQDVLGADSRAPDLVRHLDPVLSCGGLDADERRGLLERAVLGCVGALEKGGQHARAIDLAGRLLAAFPDRLAYQDRLSDLMFKQALA